MTPMYPMPEPFVDLGVALYAFLANPYSWLLYGFLGLAAVNWGVRSVAARLNETFDRSRFLDVVAKAGLTALVLLGIGTLSYAAPEPARYGLIVVYVLWTVAALSSEAMQFAEDVDGLLRRLGRVVGLREKAVEPVP